MVAESQSDYPNRTAVIKTVAGMLRITSPEQLPAWMKQAED